MRTIGYAANAKASPLKPHVFERRELRPNDVCMEVLYCGICHSDMHMVNDDWGMAIFPMVLGHEIIGRVIAVGTDVKKYKVGDNVAVVDSCMVCDQCRNGEEQLCREFATLTYCGCDRIDGSITQEPVTISVYIYQRKSETLSPNSKQNRFRADFQF